MAADQYTPRRIEDDGAGNNRRAVRISIITAPSLAAGSASSKLKP
jgi:hypothetical protein